MTKIDFYILPTAGESAREQLACRLAEKAWRLGHRVYIHTDHESQGRRLEQLLWNFRPDAFVPHECGCANPAPVCIAWGADPGDHHEVLILLGRQRPDFFSRFERLTEIVCQAADSLAASRESWKFYQQRGYPLQSHRL